MAVEGVGGAALGRAPPCRAADAAADRPSNPPVPVRYLRMFNGFFTNTSMTSTYKVAFLRALADIGGYGSSPLAGGEWIGHLDGACGGSRQGGLLRSRRNVVLDLNFVAVRFAKFYWDMEIGFGLLHVSPGSYTSRRPRRLRMAKLVRQEAKEYRPGGGAGDPDPCVPVPRLDELASGRFAGLRKRTVSVLRRDVLNAVIHDMPDLYEVVPGRQYILLDADMIPFMREYGPTLKRALNHKLAVMLERLNPEARHIATKTDEAPVAERVAAAKSLAEPFSTKPREKRG